MPAPAGAAPGTGALSGEAGARCAPPGDTVRILLPDGPPALPREAARALLRSLLAAQGATQAGGRDAGPHPTPTRDELPVHP